MIEWVDDACGDACGRQQRYGPVRGATRQRLSHRTYCCMGMTFAIIARPEHQRQYHRSANLLYSPRRSLALKIPTQPKETVQVSNQKLRPTSGEVGPKSMEGNFSNRV